MKFKINWLGEVKPFLRLNNQSKEPINNAGKTGSSSNLITAIRTV